MFCCLFYASACFKHKHGYNLFYWALLISMKSTSCNCFCSTDCFMFRSSISLKSIRLCETCITDITWIFNWNCENWRVKGPEQSPWQRTVLSAAAVHAGLDAILSDEVLSRVHQLIPCTWNDLNAHVAGPGIWFLWQLWSFFRVSLFLSFFLSFGTLKKWINGSFFFSFHYLGADLVNLYKLRRK